MPQHREGEGRTAAGRPEFEQLLLEVSTLFINLPVDSIDSVIEDTQRKICQNLGYDLSTLWQWSDRDRNLMTLTHLYTIPGGPDKPADMDASRSFPWVLEKMLRGETLAFSNDDLPDEAAIDRASRIHYGVESTVVIPMRPGGQRIIGILTFETLKRKRLWSGEEVQRLRLVADTFAHSLIRKQAEKKLLESEERLKLAAESEEAGLWELD